MKEDLVNRNYWNKRAENYDRLFKKSMHRLQVTEIISQLMPKKIGCYLDIGCGSGLATSKIFHGRRMPQETHLLDLSDEMLKLASKRLLKFKPSLHLKSMAEKLPFEDKKFDLVHSSFAIHHISDCKKRLLFHEIKRVVKSDGLILIADEIVFQKGMEEVPADLMMQIFYSAEGNDFFEHTFKDFVEYPSKIDDIVKVISDAGLKLFNVIELTPITGILAINA